MDTTYTEPSRKTSTQLQGPLKFDNAEFMPTFDITEDTTASCSTGTRMYVRKVGDPQRLSDWMRESGSPALAANDAAPILKLCPE